jgi:hypothetical protein
MIGPFSQEKHERNSPLRNLLPPIILTDNQLHVIINLFAPFSLQNLLIEILVPVEKGQNCQFLLINLVVVDIDVRAPPFLDLYIVQEERLED